MHRSATTRTSKIVWLLRVFMFVGACLFLFVCQSAQGQNSSGKSSGSQRERGERKDDPTAILEVGAAMNWNFSGGAATFVPNLAAEVTPIENWLKLEAGVSPFYTKNSTEWDTDLFFKKPWTLSRRAEFMMGGLHQADHSLTFYNHALFAWLPDHATGP